MLRSRRCSRILAPASILTASIGQTYRRRWTVTGNPAFHLDKVTDLRILLSRAAKDTQLDSADNKTL